MSSTGSNTAGGIHGHLLKLHQSFSDEDKRAAALTCHDIVGDLGRECMETSTENKLGKTSPLIRVQVYFRIALSYARSLTSRRGAAAPVQCFFSLPSVSLEFFSFSVALEVPMPVYIIWYDNAELENN